jgi:AraC-like DNA-binding protein
MRENPQMLLTNVAEESGFSSEKSFFRTFKAKTGLTPTQWKQSSQE